MSRIARTLWALATAVLLAVAPLCVQAASYIQSGFVDAGAVTGASLAFGSNVTAHSTLIAVVRVGNGTGATGVSDNVNGAWTKAKGQTQTTDGHTAEIWYFLNAAAGATTVSETQSSATLRMGIMEGAVGASGAALDKTNSGQADSSTAVNSGNVTTTVAAEWLVGVETNGGAPTFTVGTGYTTRQITGKIAMFEKDVASTGTYVADGTLNTADNWAAIIATFSAAGGGGGGGTVINPISGGGGAAANPVTQ